MLEVHDRVRSLLVKTEPQRSRVLLEVEGRPRPPALFEARHELDPSLEGRTGASQGFRENVPLQAELVFVPEPLVGTASAALGVEAGGGSAPLGRIEELDDLGPSEAALHRGDAHAKAIAGEGLGYEDHPPLVTGKSQAPIDGLLHVQLEGFAHREGRPRFRPHLDPPPPPPGETG